MKLLFTVLLSTCLFTALADAKSTRIRLDGAKASDLTIHEVQDGSLELSAALSFVDAKDVSINGENFFAIESFGLQKIFGEGAPNLPVFSKLVEIPVGATIRIDVLSYNEETIDMAQYGISNKLVPAQPSISKSAKSETLFVDQHYRLDSFTGSKLVKVEDIGIMRSVRLARIEVSPFEYNAVTNVLKVKNNIRARVSFDNVDDAAQDQLRNDYSSMIFNDSLSSTVSNLKSFPFEREMPTFVIVTAQKYVAALAPFIDYKKQSMNVIVATTEQIGTTTTAIKSYLTNLYKNPAQGFQPQHFVLFVGDVDVVPAFKGTSDSSHVTDLPYCEYTGDTLPDALYGRFSVSSEQELKDIVAKTLTYEQRTMADPSYLSRVIMVAGEDASHQLTWGNGQINYGTDNYFNAANGMTVLKMLQPDTARVYSATIKKELSAGIGFANYTAHCSSAGWAAPSFVKSDLSNLTNEGKFGVWIGNCCQSSKFEEAASFGEMALRLKNKGAVGYIGTSNYSYWDEDYWFGAGFKPVVANPVFDPKHLGAYDRMFRNNEMMASQIILTGNLAVQESTSSRKLYYWEIYNLMGDPSLVVQFK